MDTETIIKIIGGILIFFFLIGFAKRRRNARMKKEKGYWVGQTVDNTGQVKEKWLKPKHNLLIKIPLQN